MKLAKLAAGMAELLAWFVTYASALAMVAFSVVFFLTFAFGWYNHPEATTEFVFRHNGSRILWVSFLLLLGLTMIHVAERAAKTWET